MSHYTQHLIGGTPGKDLPPPRFPMKRLAVTGELKSIDVERRQVEHLISTSAPDRVGDIISSRGGEFDAFMKNPVILTNHSYKVESIVGTALKLTPSDDGIIARSHFPGVTQLGEDAWNLVRANLARAWSIGFKPIERHSIKQGRDQKCKTCLARFEQLAEGHDVGDHVPGTWGEHFVRWELLEYSLVAIPMNADAVSAALRSGIVHQSSAKALFKTIAPPRSAVQRCLDQVDSILRGGGQ